jgi:molybdopterin/thiamine biosynthesis adenylyltransferase
MDERSEREDGLLNRARVLVIGVGALGCPAARALAAAGVGTIVLVDPDRVEVSNLHRQTLHSTATIGQPKVESAAAALRREFPFLRVETHPVRLDEHNLPALFADADFVIDATDGAAAKFLINDGAVHAGLAYSHAGILGFLGQTMTIVPGTSACYRCLFPEPPSEAEVVSCRDAGVVGPLAGIIGTIQAGEAIKHLTGHGEPLADRLLTIDARTGRWRLVRLARNPRCPVCGPAAARRLDAANPAR